jgi:hypothetical protein
VAKAATREVAPNDWCLHMILDRSVEVIGDESFATRDEAVEEIIDRLAWLCGPDQHRSVAVTEANTR